MTTVDYVIAERAEFINAFSVMQRLVGQKPIVPDSMVAQKLGAVGEFGSVIFINVVISGILTLVVRLLRNEN